MSSSIPIYEGDRPYIFISYAHANSPAVMAVVRELTDRGFRVWYDNGIEVGSEWPEYIAGHLASAGLMIAFLSNAYMRSENCRKEMHFALSKKIPVINVFLEETQMTPGMELQVGNLFALMKYTMSEGEFFRKLFSAPQLEESLRDAVSAGGEAQPQEERKTRREKIPIDLNEEARKQKKKRTRRVVLLSVLGCLLTALLILGIIGHFTGINDRLLIMIGQPSVSKLPGNTVVTFENKQLEEQIRYRLGIPEKPMTVHDLRGITELSLPSEQFCFTELQDLRFFSSLRSLSLTGQPLGSLEAMPILPLESLDLSRCDLHSLQGIGNLPRLRDLVTDGSPLIDCGDLESCLQLRKVSFLGAQLTDFSSFIPLTRVAEFAVSNAFVDDLGPVLGHEHLTDLVFDGCDLRGGFFSRFDRERIIVSLSLQDCQLNSTDNLEDFRSLTTLTLIRTGENLDWSILASLDKLNTVTVDPTLEPVLRAALEGTDIRLVVLDA